MKKTLLCLFFSVNCLYRVRKVTFAKITSWGELLNISKQGGKPAWHFLKWLTLELPYTSIYQQFHSSVYTYEQQKHMSIQNVYTNVHSSIIHNNQKMETRPSNNEWIFFSVVNSYNWILFGNKKGLIHTSTGMNPENITLSERSQTQATQCTLLFIWNVQKRKIHRDRKLTSACQELGKREWAVTSHGYGIFLWRGENVLEAMVMVAQFCTL